LGSEGKISGTVEEEAWPANEDEDEDEDEDEEEDDRLSCSSPPAPTMAEAEAEVPAMASSVPWSPRLEEGGCGSEAAHARPRAEAAVTASTNEDTEPSSP
jgi:hypothetical protein